MAYGIGSVNQLNTDKYNIVGFARQHDLKIIFRGTGNVN
jgi:hypothetical protein